jgi:Zn-dependent protease with chaperone function
MSWPARWFNGRDSTPHPVVVDLGQDELRLQPAGESGAASAPAALPIAAILVSERFSGLPRKLQLPDGSTLAVDDDGEGSFDLALRMHGHRRGLATTLMQTWPRAIACLCVLVAFLVWMDRQGAGLLASRILPLVPMAVDQRLGAAVGTILDTSWMAPSKVPDERQVRLRERLRQMVAAQHPELSWELTFRNMRNSDDAFNALTLPDGTIVLLDGLTGSLTDEQVIAVVGHELGHVVHRHTMQRLLRQAGLLAMSSVVLGDVSSLGAAVTAGYQDLHYSRDAEREADAFAIEFLRRSHLPLRHIAEAFEEMRAQETSGDMPGFLSSHPPTEERLQLAREAAAQ